MGDRRAANMGRSWIALAQSLSHARYFSRGMASSYAQYLIPRLYGGDVTTISIDRATILSRMPAMQSARCAVAFDVEIIGSH